MTAHAVGRQKRMGCRSGRWPRLVRGSDVRRVKGLVWLGIPAEDYAGAVRFFTETLGLVVAFEEADTMELSAANDDRIQVFGPGHHYFQLYQDIGARIVPLFEVDNLDEARAELARSRAAEVFGDPQSDGVWTWLTFRAPDGNIYSLGARHGVAGGAYAIIRSHAISHERMGSVSRQGASAYRLPGWGGEPYPTVVPARSSRARDGLRRSGPLGTVLDQRAWVCPRWASGRALSEPGSRRQPGHRDSPAAGAGGKEREEPAPPGSAHRRPRCGGRAGRCAGRVAADQRAGDGVGLALVHPGRPRRK